MNQQTMNLNQLRIRGLEALIKALGPVGMVRFLQQFDTGAGDYTKERVNFIKQMSLEQIIKAIEERRPQ